VSVAEVLEPKMPREELSSWEMKETIFRIIEHGFDNVRGWEWTDQRAFGRDEYAVFKTNAFGMADLCRRCGNFGHVASTCGGRPKAAWLQQCEYAQQEPHRSSAAVLQGAVARSNETAKRQRLSGFRDRCCKDCGGDISGQPITHQYCPACYEEQPKQPRAATAAKRQRSQEQSHARSSTAVDEFRCAICGGHTRTSRYTQMCSKCCGGTRQCESCGVDISSQPPTHQFCRECFDGTSSGSGTDSGSGSGSESEDEDSGFACDFCGKEFDTLKGATFHENFHCKLRGRGR